MPINLATDYVNWEQRLEGQRIADWQWGTANAKQIVVSGVFTHDWGPTLDRCVSLSIRNAALNRSYVTEIFKWVGKNPPPAIPTVVPWTAVIPGCTDGVWPIDNTLGALINISLYVGTNYQTTTPNTWLASNRLGTNSPATVGALGYFVAHTKISNLGIYLDPYKTGVAPPFQIPNIVDEVRRSQRYWYRAYGLRGWTIGANWVNAQFMKHPVPMRATPAAAIVGAPAYYDGVATAAASVVQANSSNPSVLELNFTLAASTLTAGRVGINYWDSDANYIAVSARM